MAFPWMAAATIASSLLPFIFGGTGEQRRVTETEVPPAGWQDPMLGLMSPLIADILSRRIGGFGEGSSVYSPWVSKIIEMLGGQFPQILRGAGAPEGIVTRRPALATSGGI